jgi:2-succinyl-6-hydroxy-2,4-cyclohexadiene-1-carboxylate synthase
MILQANEINYFVDVKGEGFPLVFLHGFTGDTRTWEEITEHLKKSWTCIAIDIIGHGKSDSPSDAARYTMDAVSNDIRSLLEQLGVKKAVFIGYSMGGRLALHFSSLYPDYVSALILESASPGLRTDEEQTERREKDQVLANKILDEGIRSFVDFWEEIPLFSTQKRLSRFKQKKIREQRLQQSPVGLSNSLKGMGTGAQASWWGTLGDLNVPVILMAGELDLKFVRIAKDMSDENPDFEIITFIGTGHAIHVEEPRKFGTIIEEVLFKYIKEDVKHGF